MSLVPAYGESSESSDESSSDIEDKSETEEKDEVNLALKCVPKLPTPDFKVKTAPDDDGVRINSVFNNPFLDEENEKEAALQKHVKMVDLNNTIIINGKKICWNYRKGKCRFGHNCKFAHDSDIQKPPEQIEAEKIKNQSAGIVVLKGEDLKMKLEENVDETNLSVKNLKRKKFGLTQGLVPGKKVMKNYMQQKK